MAPGFKTVSSIARGTFCAAFLCFAASAAAAATTAAAPVGPRTVNTPTFDNSALMPTLPQATTDVALQFVVKTGVTKNLSLLLLNEIKHDAAVQAAVARHGMTRVQNAVVKSIRIAQRDYADDWNSVLASIYREHMAANELADIIAKREASPHFIKLLDLQDKIATALTSRGEKIFSRARQDVMRRLVTELAS